MRKIHLRIRELAEQQGLTVDALAERAKVPARTVHRLFCNQYASVTFHTVARISEVLHAYLRPYRRC